MVRLFGLCDEVSLGTHDEIIQLCIGIFNQGIRSVPMLSFILDAYEERLLVKNADQTTYNHAIEVLNFMHVL